MGVLGVRLCSALFGRVRRLGWVRGSVLCSARYPRRGAGMTDPFGAGMTDLFRAGVTEEVGAGVAGEVGVGCSLSGRRGFAVVRFGRSW